LQAAAFMSSGDSGSSGQMPAVQSLVAAVAASAAALLLPVFSLTSITSSLFGTAVKHLRNSSSLGIAEFTFFSFHFEEKAMSIHCTRD